MMIIICIIGLYISYNSTVQYSVQFGRSIIDVFHALTMSYAVVQVLRHFIKSVLEAAHKRKLKTVAIPAVGTGMLKFPADKVASCLFNECDKFSANHSQSQTTVREIRLVVYEKDQSTFDVSFTACLINHHRCSVLMVEYRIRTAEVMGSIPTLVQLQATLSKSLTYCVLRPTQPPILSGTGNECRLPGEGPVWLVGAVVCRL